MENNTKPEPITKSIGKNETKPKTAKKLNRKHNHTHTHSEIVPMQMKIRLHFIYSSTVELVENYGNIRKRV